MGVIKPTLTLTANAATATTDAGPLSTALSLSIADSLTVDTVNSKIVTCSTSHALLYDGSTMQASGAELATEVARSDSNAGTGGFLYFSNISTASTTNFIYIGLGSDASVTATDIAAGDQVDVYSDTDDASIIRLMTLAPGEFAWMPFDYTYNIFVDANAADQKLECWHFNRSLT
tara:strand:- start:89 stop:613 length:525 start_codon:yes stop_codon:yes gene_type:complete